MKPKPTRRPYTTQLDIDLRAWLEDEATRRKRSTGDRSITPADVLNEAVREKKERTAE